MGSTALGTGKVIISIKLLKYDKIIKGKEGNAYGNQI
ncbi:hypothetical protein IMSAGC011_02544 [Lachnospiraceae bacterium]|nr:hypothetical protein IMSAGC011_02544 [Lachnospiraceae bacterium]